MPNQGHVSPAVWVLVRALTTCGPRQAPVFRELYSEKRVVAEERFMRIDNSPQGRWQEQFGLRALGNNYRRLEEIV
jgi:hypothetical protein